MSAKTGPGRARSSRSSPGCISRTTARSCSTGPRSSCAVRLRPVPWGSRWSTRSHACSPTSRSPRMSSSATRQRGAFGTIDWGAMRRETERIFGELDVRLDADAIVRGLSMADQQLIEIARALSINATVLVLDEPTASLSVHEVERLFAIVRQTRARGVAVLFVSHRLDEVFDLCDLASVLRDGKHVVTRPTSELTTADLVRHMVGRAVSLFPKVEAPLGDVLLEVEGLSRGEDFRDVSFAVRAGEILGLAGLVGAGRTEIARVLFGVDVADDGVIRLAGVPVSFASPSAALKAGDRLRARGPPPGRAHPGLLHLIQRDAADPASALPEAVPPRGNRARGRRALHRRAADPGARGRPTRCIPYPGATNRRSCSASGLPPSHAC